MIMDNTVDDVMIVCKTRNHQNFAKVFAGFVKTTAIPIAILMKHA